MRLPIFVLPTIVLAICQSGFSQECNLKVLCEMAISKDLKPKERQILYDNWNDYFAVDLEKEFPVPDKRSTNVFSIRFDGMGCIYPPFFNSSDDRVAFIDESRAQKKFDKLSFYRLIATKPETILNRSMTPIQMDSIKAIINRASSSLPDSYFDFREFWNKQFIPSAIQELNYIIKTKKIKKVFVFIHGFNVPYSLAHIQGNEIFGRILNSQSVQPSEVLFVRIFWPSLSLKRKDFLQTGRCNIKNQKLAVFLTSLFSYVSNRAYLCGLSLNQIVRDLPDTIQYNFISHSFGSSISAAMLFSPESKMKAKNINTPYNQRLLALFNTQSKLTEKTIRFFMNAPGMPGITTFKSISAQNNQNHKFHIGYNNKDEIQLKQFWFLKFPARFSSTALGCNHNGEADSLRNFAKCAKLESNFCIKPTKDSPEHDIFCYLQINEFLDFFDEFLKQQ